MKWLFINMWEGVRLLFSRGMTQCVRCGSEFKSTNNKDTCLSCRMVEEEESKANLLKQREELEELLEVASKNVLVATTPILYGYEIEEYLGVESASAYLSESYLDESLERSKDSALKKLKFKAVELGGNAVIGIDIDYTEIDSHFNTVVSGTVVKVRKINRVDTLSV